MPFTSCARLISDLNHFSSLKLEFPIRVPERFRAGKQALLTCHFGGLVGPRFTRALA